MKRDRAQPLRIPAVAGSGPDDDGLSRAAAGKVLHSEKWLVRKLLHSIGNPPIGIALWNGEEVNTSGAAAEARLHISDRNALLKLIGNPDLQFGELYVEGRLRVEGDLERFLNLLYRGIPDFRQRRPWSRVLSKLYLLKRNTQSRAKDNIYHHYDLGNDFYRLWLDQRMLYTCAYFPDRDLDLEQAQLAKMDHVARKLKLRPGQQVIEAGCGWGALALHMAEHYGVSVTAYNISKEQLAYARERAAERGLSDRVEFVECDYRDIRGDCDAFVSVGMLEHVGVKHFRELGATIDRVLRPDGRGLIHTIGRNRPAPMNAWIERRIFPGAYPPSLGEMSQIFEPFGFSTLDVENLRLHYALTLRHWLQRFEASVDKVRAAFDDAFVRAWRLYLAGSIASFHCGELQLFQVLFNRFDNNDVDLTRAFIYPDR